MNRTTAEKRVRDLLKTVLKGSPREIPLDDPLGGAGLGLDSLAIVEFVVAFENQFRVQVPESVWEDIPAITPAYFVGLLAGDD